jgi:MFS family permease
MGISASGVVMAPLGAYLIGAVGWRATFLIYAAVASIVLLPLIRRYVVSRPEDMGLHPDGDATAHPEDAAPDADALASSSEGQMIDHPARLEWSAAGIMRDRNFWVIVLVMGMNFFAMSALLTHMVPYTEDLGFTLQQAATILAASAGIGVIGKVIIGWLTDHIETRVAFWFAIAFQAGGALMLHYVHAYWGLFIAAAVFGFGMGGVMPLWGSLVGDAYDRHSFGRVMGLTSPCMLPLQCTGVPFAGFIYDVTNSYDVAFMVFFGVYVASAAMLLFFRPVARLRQPVKTRVLTKLM